MSRLEQARQWWPFAALCVVEWLRLNLLESVTGSASTLWSEAVGCAVAAVAAWFVVWRAGSASRPSRRIVVTGAIAGALLLCGPQTALFFDVEPSAAGVVIALALTPVVVAVCLAASRSGVGLSAAALWPGIAAAAGLLLLITQPSLEDVLSDAAWLVAPIAAGIGCVWLGRLRGSAAWAAASGLGGAAVVFVMGALISERGVHAPSPVASGFDCALAVLSVLAVIRLRPLQYTARFPVVPLLVLMEGAVLIRQVPGVRSVCGLVILSVAAVALLWQSESEPDQVPSLRT